MSMSVVARPVLLLQQENYERIGGEGGEGCLDFFPNIDEEDRI